MNALRRWLRAAFGTLHWTAPPWSLALARRQREAPARFYGVIATGFLLLVAGYAGWRWWQTRPQPEYVTFEIQEPAPTPLPTAELPEPAPNPLVVRFSDSAAPLDRAGKAVATDFQLDPAFAGSWTWTNDRELTFQPAQDWPVGQEYALRFEQAFFAPQVLLERYALAFSSPALRGELAEQSFYEDPTDARNKRVTASFAFTHPLERASFEKRVSVRLRVEPAKSFDDPSVESFGFKVSYDETGAKAFVQSEPVALPERNGEMEIAVARGVGAARGGAPSTDAPQARVRVPSVESYFRVESAAASVVTNDAHLMERVVSLQFSAPVRSAELAPKVAVYELPKDRPAIGDLPAEANHTWRHAREVVPEVLARAKRLDVTWLPTQREHEPLHVFRYSADAGRQLYLRVEAGTRSFGDYALAKPYARLIPVEELPRAIEILHDGSLLALTGDRKLSVLVRNLAAVELELARLRPDTLAQLATQSSGRFQQPDFRYGFDTDDLAEVFREVRELPAAPPGTPQYVVVDFSSFLARGAPPHGLFQLRVRGYDPEKQQALGAPDDRRVLLVSDLGFLVKDAHDGTHDVFVMSLRSGQPVAGAEVAILGRNGLPAFARRSDASGRATLPSFADLKREKAPAVYVVRQGDDLAFLPYARLDRRVDFSRSDVGGVEEDARLESLQAYLFSDRGIYRPGEELRIGLIVKPADWSPLPEALPLELVVIDPRGVEVRRQPILFPASGFRDWRLKTLEASPTGPWQVQLWIKRDEKPRALLGSTRVRVEEFQPDRLAIDVKLSQPPSPGWIAPEALAANVTLKNLFGTPAAGNLVKATLTLSPSYPAFEGWSDWSFFDPLGAKQGFEEALADVHTDEQGQAALPLGLERFTRATYRMRLLVQGFESDSGRSVAMDVGAIVSPLPWLLAWKADGDLGYVARGASREVELRAVGPDLRARAGGSLRAERVEVKWVSLLQRQPNGLLAYQSVEKQETREMRTLELAESGTRLALPTDAPGSFVWILRDASGTELNRIAYEVVGEGDLNARVDRTASLAIRLDKTEYAAGEEIELEVRAPYTGTGLLTIERDRVYAAQWFRSDTTASVQRIRVPAELEGNGYVVVSFVRALDSREVFLSPLSSGAAPFALSRAPHRRELALDVPAKLEPGARLRIGYTLPAPMRLAVLAVDEGILQVARWQKPDPLGHFFRKRALAVTTSQILDLLLPEFELFRAASAAGGGEDALPSMGNLNPFKRKGLPPVAFWSGVIDAPAGPGSFDYTLPDHFEGSLRVVAVGVDERAVGVAEARSVVRGPFVLQPTIPYFAAPGDEFEASTLVANTLEGSGAGLPVEVTLTASPGLELVGDARQTLKIDEGKDANARFRVRVVGEPGAATLAFAASSGARTRRSSLELSVRPAAPFRSELATRATAGGGSLELPITRELFPQLRDVHASASTSPFGLAGGLADWLALYPHWCSEQIVSAAMPGVLLAAHPDLAPDAEQSRRLFERALAILQGRQDADGAFARWHAGGDVHPFVTAYATHFLLESRARGQAVPQSMLERALSQLEASVSERAETLPGARARAYALYLVTKQGVVKTEEARALAEDLRRLGDDARRDVAALLLAATLKLLRLDAEAEQQAKGFSLSDPVESRPEYFYDALVHRAFGLYLLASHFPERAKRLGPGARAAAPGGRGRAATTRSRRRSRCSRSTPTRSCRRRRPRRVSRWRSWRRRPSRSAGRQRHAAPARAALRGGEGGARHGARRHAALPPADGVGLRPHAARRHRRAWRRGAARAAEARPETLATQAVLNEKLDVVLRVRATDGKQHELAIVDLLPGGFEVDPGAGELKDFCSIDGGITAWQPDYVDVREDRVVFYGWVGDSVQEFVYRIVPTNRGRYAVPPVQAEGLYDRSVEARSSGGTLEVTD